MERLAIPFERLSVAQLDERFGFKGLPADYVGFLQPDGGTINVPRSLEVMLAQLRADRRVTLAPNQRVTGLRSLPSGVSVSTAGGSTHHAGKLVLAAGPYTNRMLAHINTRLYYGFEEVAWSNRGYIRVAPAYAEHVITCPDRRTPEPSPRDIELTSRWVRKHMPGLDPAPKFTSSCLAALPVDPDQKMFLDFAPDSSNIVVFAGGWAFKYLPLLGKICADLAIEGETCFDISKFRIPATPKATVSPAALRRRSLAY